MRRIMVMRPDIRQAVWREREESVPCRIDFDPGERGQQRFEIVTQLLRGTCECRALSKAGDERAIAAAKQQTVVGSPSSIVIWTFGVPNHHVAETDLAPLCGAQRRCG